MAFMMAFSKRLYFSHRFTVYFNGILTLHPPCQGWEDGGKSGEDNFKQIVWFQQKLP